jgi:hypothetical protein
MLERMDRWWSVSATSDERQVGAEVVAAIRDFGIPWLRGRMA